MCLGLTISYIWRHSLQAVQNACDPTELGWERDSTGKLVPIMSTQAPATPELLNDVICECQKSVRMVASAVNTSKHAQLLVPVE